MAWKRRGTAQKASISKYRTDDSREKIPTRVDVYKTVVLTDSDDESPSRKQSSKDCAALLSLLERPGCEFKSDGLDKRNGVRIVNFPIKKYLLANFQ